LAWRIPVRVINHIKKQNNHPPHPPPQSGRYETDIFRAFFIKRWLCHYKEREEKKEGRVGNLLEVYRDLNRCI